jgi:hypothetical protein
MMTTGLSKLDCSFKWLLSSYWVLHSVASVLSYLSS